MSASASPLPLRPYGRSGLAVTALGFGAMQVGAPELDERDAAALLHGVLDLGIRLVDTARSYGIAEERIGRHLERRRGEFVLSTKVGYGVDGCADWTYECVARGIDLARDRLRTDVIDVVHLHSCPRETLERSGVADALAAAVAAGKVRVAAYSGERDALDHAIARSEGRNAAFGAIQLSVNLVEPLAPERIAAACARGLGVLAKRPLLGLPWLASSPPDDPPHAEYSRRFGSFRAAYAGRATSPARDARAAADLSSAEWAALALRYATFAAGVDACLVGGTRLPNVRANIECVRAGPLAPDELDAIRRAQASIAGDRDGVI